MSEAFINAISEGHKDEVIKWLQQIYSENEQLRHDITRHVQICAEQANEIVELRAWKEGKRGVEEYFALKGDNAELRKQLADAKGWLKHYERGEPAAWAALKKENAELRKQLEQAEGRCKKLWDEIASIHGATSPASPQADPTPQGASPKDR